MRVGLLVFSLLIATLGYCEEDPKFDVYPRESIMTFKGLDSNSTENLTADGRARDLQNVKLSFNYSLSKRNGYNTIGRTLDIPDVDFQPITGIYYTKFSNGNGYIIATCGNRVHRYNSTSSTWDIISAGLITSGQNNQFVWTTAADYIIGTNNTDIPIRVNNTLNVSQLSFSGLTNPITQAKCVTWFRNYLVWGNTVENSVNRKTRIRWSNVGFNDTYSNDDFIDIDALGGQEIEGFAQLYDNLYVFLTDSIYQVSLVGGDEIFKVSKIVDNIGCIAKNSIQSVILSNERKGIVFLTKDKKIYFFDGITATDISILIKTTMSTLNASRLQYAVSTSNGYDYYLAVTDGSGNSTNNLVLDLQLEIAEWTKHTQIDANAMALVLDSSNLSQIYFGNYDAFIYKTDDTSLDSDVSGHTGTFESTGTFTTTTASGLQIIYDNDATFTATGSIVRITSGTGKGQEKVIVYSNATGIVVDSTFSTTPDSTSIYKVGDIDAFYQTKWFDLGFASQRKTFGELYLWTTEEGGADLSVNYSLDFGSVIRTQSVSLQDAGATWGVSKWGQSTWGGATTVFNIVKLSGEGRYITYKFFNDDVGETFSIHGYTQLFWRGDVQ